MRAIVAILIFSFCVASVAFSEGKVTVDPNAPGTVTNQETVIEKDERLDQKVTYEAKDKTVAEILKDLTVQTGIVFRAGQNSKDWESQDVKMCIFAKDLPLRELMNSMARVMKFRWVKEGEPNAYTYRFYMSGRTKQEAEARRIREEEDARKRIIEKRTKAFESYMAAANASPAELEKLKKENPFLYVAAKENLLQPIVSLFRQVPGVYDALLNGQELSIPASELSSEAQTALVQSVRNIRRFEKKITGLQRGIPDDLSDKLSQTTISINKHLADVQDMRGMDFLLGIVQIELPKDQMHLPIMDPESSIAQLFGKAILTSEEEQKPLEDQLQKIESEAAKAIQEYLKKSDTGDPEPEHPDEPALHEKYTFNPQKRQFPEVLAELAKVTGLSIVADRYDTPLGLLQLKNEQIELKEILDAIATGYSYNWEKHGSVLEFRDKMWYKKRAAMIPQAVIKAWRDKLKKTGTLDIDDLAQIANLTFEQFRMNVASEKDLSRTTLMPLYFSSRDILRLYGALSETQRAMLFANEGLDLHSLSPEQWVLAAKIISARNSTYLSLGDVPIIMTAKAEAVGKQVAYSITISTEGLDPIRYNFTTPAYVDLPPRDGAEKTDSKSEPQNPQSQESQKEPAKK